MFRSRRKLTRQRKQLLISGGRGGDQDGGGGAMNKCPNSPLPEIASSLATPQPLPLPELVKERCRKERGSGCNSGDFGDSRLPSPKAGDGAALNTQIQRYNFCDSLL